MADRIKILTEQEEDGSWTQTITPNGQVQLFKAVQIGEMNKQHNDLVLANTESAETSESSTP